MKQPVEQPPVQPTDPLTRDTFVFLDPHGKRWPRFRLLMFLGGLLFFLAAILFIQVLVLPSRLTTPPVVEQLKSSIKALQRSKAETTHTAVKPLWLNYAKTPTDHLRRAQSSTKHAVPPLADQGQKQAHTASGPAAKEIKLGFYENGNPDSFDSLQEHANNLTHLCPDWLGFDGNSGELVATKDEAVVTLSQTHKVVLMPLLRNLGSGDQWLAEAVEGLINGPTEQQDRFLAHLIETLQDMEAGGLILDWQQVDPSYRNNMTAFLNKMADHLHAAHLEVWLTVSTGRDFKIFDLDALSSHIDKFVAMLHDEHAEFDDPGPIASREFFHGWLSTLLDNYATPNQWVISLGAYGYDWTEGLGQAERLSFADVMSRAGRATQTHCEFHHPSLNPHFDYAAGTTSHSVWFLDALTFYNQLAAVRSRHAGGVAINQLGAEDPGIWDALSLAGVQPVTTAALAPLTVIRSGADIAEIGRGNLITIVDERRNGSRQLHIDAKAAPGAMIAATYTTFPSYLTVLHQGRGPADGVAITFDDGPDAKWTPKILDILKAKQVKATFLMLGANMEKNPSIVQRILDEGHTIGSHTYSHPNVAQVSEERAHLEFNATQRLIESITGHSSIVFRPPYNADTNPHEADELIPIKLAQDMGYITITADIDPKDWDRPGVTAMLDRVRQGRNDGGNVILLHDAGGDRSQTVAALPLIIDYLQARGDRVLALPEFLDIPVNQLMPPLPADQQPLIRMISESGFTAIHETTNFFWAFMIVATALTVLKTLVVSWLALRSRRLMNKTAQDAAQDYAPPVSVLIAAYNEEKVIGETLRAVLNTQYQGAMEIIVVDDGSKDDTAAIVAAMAEQEPRIRLIRQTNFGKATALRNGLQAVGNEIVVSLDADTQFTPQTIGALVQPFVNPKVGAVSGRARVGNPKTLMARFQSLEYTCGFNLDRRAYHLWNCITVVPGAVSALRVSAIAAAGGISTETLAEDTDLTLALHRCGYVIEYAPTAVAWTEAPETVGAFAKQRFRWAFGTLQCLWKHREMLFNSQYKALGWFSLPNAWFFNIFLVAFGSIIDLTLIFSLLVSPANGILYFYFFIFLVADLLLAAVACLVEGEPLGQIWLVLPMRFIYRPVLNIVVIRAIVRALKGVWVGWGKLDRTASVAYRA